MTRTYHSPLREEQREQTRERILAQVAEILASKQDVELTVAEAAKRANVSVRTAYRYFPTKEALIDGFNAWMQIQFGTVSHPKTLDEMTEYVAALYRAFAANEQLVRAARRSPHGAEVRHRRKAEQMRVVSKAVAAAAPNLDPDEVHRAAANLLSVFGSEVWIQLRDQWGMSNEECIESARWGIDAMVIKLRKRNQAAKANR